MTPTPTPVPNLGVITFGAPANGWDAVLTFLTQAVAIVIAILLALWIQRREFKAATKDRADIVSREQTVLRESWRRVTAAEAINALWSHGDERLFKQGGDLHATRRALVGAAARFRLDPEVGGDQAAEWFRMQIEIVDLMTPYSRTRSDEATLALRARVRGYIEGVEDALVQWQRGSTNEWLSSILLEEANGGPGR